MSAAPPPLEILPHLPESAKLWLIQQAKELIEFHSAQLNLWKSVLEHVHKDEEAKSSPHLEIFPVESRQRALAALPTNESKKKENEKELDHLVMNRPAIPSGKRKLPKANNVNHNLEVKVDGEVKMNPIKKKEKDEDGLLEKIESKEEQNLEMKQEIEIVKPPEVLGSPKVLKSAFFSQKPVLNSEKPSIVSQKQKNLPGKPFISNSVKQNQSFRQKNSTDQSNRSSQTYRKKNEPVELVEDSGKSNTRSFKNSISSPKSNLNSSSTIRKIADPKTSPNSRG
jgi:hypothetical protein